MNVFKNSPAVIAKTLAALLRDIAKSFIQEAIRRGMEPGAASEMEERFVKPLDAAAFPLDPSEPAPLFGGAGHHLVGISEAFGSSVLRVEERDNLFVCFVPMMVEMQVDPLEGWVRAEAEQIAAERLRELPLQVTLGGVPLEAKVLLPGI